MEPGQSTRAPQMPETPTAPLPSLTQATIDSLTPPATDTRPAPLTAAGKKQASYGALISIIIIMAIIIVGAFYAWGKRISEQGGLTPAATSAGATQTY